MEIINTVSYVKKKKKKKFYYREAIKLLTSLSEKKKPNFIKDYNYDVLKSELDLYIKWELNIKKIKKLLKIGIGYGIVC